MDTILIPPIPELDRYPQQRHLLLLHLLNNKAYRGFYQARKTCGEYLILDNSAYENGEASPSAEYIGWAQRLQVDELVVPDVLGNIEETLRRAHAFFTLLAAGTTADRPRLMLVPQGLTMEDWRGCLHLLLEMHDAFGFEKRPVIGVARRYEDLTHQGSQINGLVWACWYLDALRKGGKLDGTDVHLLGWGRQVWHLGTIGRNYPWIRSVDSAKPFHLALAEIRIDPVGTGVEYKKRPDNYFTRYLNPKQTRDAEHNISVFQMMAHGGLYL
jgi:hypothetical protein